jgi:putative ABC transport system permease protein
MFQNYFKIAFRSLRKNKLHSFINILGLSIGIAVVILIFLFVQNEFEHDKWHAGEDNIYRVYRHFGDREAGWVWSPPPLVDIMESEIPEVINAAGIIAGEDQLLDYKGKKIYAKTSAQVDSTFFLTVPLPFLYGDSETVLENPSNVVISEEVAGVLFGDKNPLGETLRIDGSWDYQVSGVLKSGTKTHLDYDVFTVMTWQVDNWTANQNATYIRLSQNADIEAVESKIYDLVTPILLNTFKENGYPAKESEMSKWGLQPIEKVHLYSKNFTWNGEARGDIRFVMIFLFIAGIVLLVAMINYMNLATARVSLRAREVGIRKVSGAMKKQLVTQFLTESILQSMIALTMAMMLAEFLLPAFNSVVDRELSFLQAGFSGLFLPLIGLGIFVGILAGIYPAFILSGFKPVTVLKGVFKQKSENMPLRKVLVVGQFSISIALIIVMSFVFKQVQFMLEEDLGFDSEQVMVVPLNLWNSKYRVMNLQNQIEAIEGVESMALSSVLPGGQISHYTLKLEGKEEPVGSLLLNCTSKFDQTLGLKLKEGRFLDEKLYPKDTINNFVVNEKFVEENGLEDPIGKRLSFVFDETPGQIVGVVENFHQSGLQSSIKPLVMNGRTFLMNTSLRVSTKNLKSTIRDLEGIWTQIEPEHPMRYSFLDADFATQYVEQERFGNAMLYATILTIFIALLGLFGLASFTAERRTKEIGVRKVLGASIQNLIGLLVKDFVWLIIFAGFIAIPAGYYFSKTWLEDFAFQTSITAFPFVIALLAALVLTALTVGFQAVKTSLANPIEALQHE